MSLKILFVILASGALLLSPRAARAQNQYSTCDMLFCDSYIYGTSEEIYGYTEIEAPWNDVWIKLEAIMVTPSFEVSLLLEPIYAQWYAEADVYYYEGQRGNYYVRGDASYLWGSPGWWQPDGSSFSNYFWAESYPSAESTALDSLEPDPEPWGAKFKVTLLPTYQGYDGGNVGEVHSQYSDACWNAAPVGNTAPPAPEDSDATVLDGAYYDSVFSGGGWVEHYTRLVRSNQISPCGWTAYQTMTFDYEDQYAWGWQGQDLDGSSVTTYRSDGSSGAVTVP